MRNAVRTACTWVSLCALTLALAIASPPTIARAEPTQDASPLLEHMGKGLIPSHKHDDQSLGDAAELVAMSSEPLPEQYRSDEQPWAEGIRVKNQDSSGLCWAFATTSAAEYSYAKEYYDLTGRVAELSPAHLAYFFYNRVNDPLGNTAGDSNSVGANSPGWAIVGGNEDYGFQHMATYSGLGTEAQTPLSMVLEHIIPDPRTGDNVWDGTHPLFAERYAYSNYATLQQTEMFTIRERDFPSVIDTMKRLVFQRGAVIVDLEYDYIEYCEERVDSAGSYEYGHAFYNYNDYANHDHALTIVGWDDTYPAENFTHARNAYGDALTIVEDGKTVRLGDQQARALTTPPGDGAWVVQNSWGAGRHHGGFFYLSYYSCEVSKDGYIAALDMQPADTYAYNFQYDGTADNGDASDSGNEAFLTVAGTSAANVYTNTTGRPITLEAVNFTTFNSGETVHDISVYTALADGDDPTGGLLAASTTCTTYAMGVKTAVLDEPVTIGAGERFAIVFSFPESTAKFGVEKWRDYGEIFHFTVRTDPGQSFFRRSGGGDWVDMDDYGACFRIKGLANAIQGTASARFAVTFEDGLGHVIDSQLVAYGQAAVAPRTPARSGYLFDGWDVDFSGVTTNLRVRATWEVDPTASTEWVRLAGSSRYETMASIVETGFQASPWVVLATGANFPDALMASSLAGLRGCPVILTDGTKDWLLEPAHRRIRDLGATNAYVVGGAGVVSEGIEEELESMGVSVTRVAGPNRQGTSVEALEELAAASPDTVVVATGWNFADALSIGPWCYRRKAPILLARNGRLSGEQVAAVRSVGSIENVVIVGGYAAVSDEVMDQLGRGYSYERLSGSNRYETSAAIAAWEMGEHGMGLANVAVTTGRKYPDALAGAALCGRNGSALLLVAPGEGGTAPALGLLEADPHAVRVGYVLGGAGAVPESLVDRLRAATA